MKRFFLVAALLASMGVQAVEVGINASRDTANQYRTGYGLTIGQKMDKVGITAGIDKYTDGDQLYKYSLVGSYDVTKIGAATVAVKAGAAYLDQKNASDGFAALVGAGVTYPLTKELAVTTDYRYQQGQTRISKLNGNALYAGVKYTF